MINIAILGLGTVGFGVYDIINKSEYFKDVKVSKILDKDLSKNVIVNNIITSNYQDILNDETIKIVVETMGASEFSYECIKKALEAKKNVVTANKEVIATHIDELTEIKNNYGVSLYYEACVGGGIPLIKPMFTASLINDITSIKGILNGTTNFILTKMTEDKLNFADALKLAKELGFAEADPTNDLEGLDMVRKIAILSDIAYKTKVNINDVYHYGISSLNENDINFADKENYVIKLVASSKKVNKIIELKVEPMFISKVDLMSKVSNENNIVECECDVNGTLMFYGKGAGRYPTANAIVNDIIMILNNDKNYSFESKNKYEYKYIKQKSKYYLRLQDINKIDKDIIEKIDRNMIITKEINFDVIEKLQKDIYFYAKIEEKK